MSTETLLDFKALAKAVCEDHNAKGVAMVAGEVSQPNLVPVNVTRDEDLLVFQGDRLTSKDLRRAMWTKWRKNRRLHGQNMFVWSFYDIEAKHPGTTSVGLGMFVADEVAARLERMRTHHGQ